MKSRMLITFIFIIMLPVSACKEVSSDHTGPTISDISTSGKVLVISDCPSTSIVITAKVTDASPITSVLLQYRVASDQPFLSAVMDLKEGLYTVSVNGADLQGKGYGAMEFHITAEDKEGNSSKSPLDQSIQFLPCVNN